MRYFFAMAYDVFTFYKFTPLRNLGSVKRVLFETLNVLDARGTVILAEEGINGTLCAPNMMARAGVCDALRALPGCADLNIRMSHAKDRPFLRLKVRLKSEIVTMGVPDTDPNKTVGEYVSAEAWNALLDDPDVVVIDTRNDYECAIGGFEGAIDPKTKSFREFPKWFESNRVDNPNAKYAMYCTGGIRCEKATSFLKSQGVDKVFHLKGGILSYLETIPEAKSKWHGDCFVFDERVSLRHGLEQGDYGMCHACKYPLTREDMASDAYQQGVSCPHCIGTISAEKRAALEERQNQINRAKARGEVHMGPNAPSSRPNLKRQ